MRAVLGIPRGISLGSLESAATVDIGQEHRLHYPDPNTFLPQREVLMSGKLVTLGTFSTPTEANIVRNHLEADGIRAFLADEAIVGMAWHLGTAVGGVKLQVAEDDVERALAVIESHGAASIAEEEWQSDSLRGAVQHATVHFLINQIIAQKTPHWECKQNNR